MSLDKGTNHLSVLHFCFWITSSLYSTLLPRLGVSFTRKILVVLRKGCNCLALAPHSKGAVPCRNACLQSPLSGCHGKHAGNTPSPIHELRCRIQLVVQHAKISLEIPDNVATFLHGISSDGGHEQDVHSKAIELRKGVNVFLAVEALVRDQVYSPALAISILARLSRNAEISSMLPDMTQY